MLDHVKSLERDGRGEKERDRNGKCCDWWTANECWCLIQANGCVCKLRTNARRTFSPSDTTVCALNKVDDTCMNVSEKEYFRSKTAEIQSRLCAIQCINFSSSLCQVHLLYIHALRSVTAESKSTGVSSCSTQRYGTVKLSVIRNRNPNRNNIIQINLIIIVSRCHTSSMNPFSFLLLRFASQPSFIILSHAPLARPPQALPPP